MKDVKPSANGEGQEVKVKVRINHNGLLLVSSAQMYEKKEAQEGGEQNGNENDASQPANQTPAEEANAASQESQNASAGEPMDTAAPPEVSIYCNFIIYLLMVVYGLMKISKISK